MPIKREMLVRKSALEQTAINETIAPEPGEGEVLLEIEAFAVTANNVTYAVVGEQIGYWNFFPAAENWGVVPVWGHARVTASRHPEIVVGERVYGFLPMATHLLVRPGKVAPGLFRDMAAHRQAMSPVYNQYRRLDADPAHDSAGEDARMLFEPLFLTSYLIADTLTASGWHGAQTLVLTSASSKTALGTAYAARVASPGVRRVGVTGPGNVGFVERSGLYDAVLAYDALEALAVEGSVVLVDFAGSAEVLQAIYAQLPGRIAQCLRVGATHREARDGAIVGLSPKPVWFFAPDVATALIGAIGQDAFNAAVAAQWRGFVDVVRAIVTIRHETGVEALQHAWREHVAGQARPDVGTILRL